MAMNKKEWRKVLGRVFVDEIPTEFMRSITIVLKDGTEIVAKDDEEFIEIVETLRFETETDPIEGVEVSINYPKLKREVEKDITELLKTVFEEKPSGDTD